jgi:hypothetical protein
VAAIIREQIIDGERVLSLGPSVLVASKSCPGAWHVVEHGACTCPGFTYRRTCRHLAVAALAAELDRCHATPAAVADDASCVVIGPAEVRFAPQYAAYLVSWHGHPHGGCHYRLDDAIAHARELAGYPLEVQNDWRAQHGLPALEDAAVA